MARLDRVITSGVFSLDGENLDVDDSVWIVGDGPGAPILRHPDDSMLREVVAGLADGRAEQD